MRANPDPSQAHGRRWISDERWESFLGSLSGEPSQLFPDPARDLWAAQARGQDAKPKPVDA